MGRSRQEDFGELTDGVLLGGGMSTPDPSPAVERQGGSVQSPHGEEVAAENVEP